MGEEQNKSALETEQEASNEKDVTETEESKTEVMQSEDVDNSAENDSGETIQNNLTDFSDNETKGTETEENISDNEEAPYKEYGFGGVQGSTADTETTTEETTNSQFENYQGQFVNVEAQEKAQKIAKRKKILYPSTIIVLVLVVASIVVYAVYSSFFQTSVKGVWVSTDVDEVTSANSLLVLGDNNEAYMSFGTMRYLGVYNTSYDDDGNKILTVDIPYALQSDFVYEMQGNDILSLTMDGDTTAYTFKKVELPDYSLTAPEDYVRDDNLLGKWKDTTYDIEYTFKNDGTMLINEAGVVEADCIYNIVDGTIHVEYLAGEVYTMDMEYSVSGDNLTIGVMNFVKVEDANGKPVQTEAQTTEKTTVPETVAETVEETTAA